MSDKVIVKMEFDSLAEAAKYFNKEYNVVKGRVAIGWSVEEALELVKRNQICIDGKTFKNKQEFCRYYNIPRSTLEYKLDKGYTLEEIIKNKSSKNNKRKYNKRKYSKRIYNKKSSTVLEGKTFKSKADAARYYNLDISVIYARERIGWTLEEAFELVERTKCNNTVPGSITVENVTYRSLMAACKHYNLNYNTVYTRISRGWSNEEAFELVPRRKKK